MGGKVTNKSLLKVSTLGKSGEKVMKMSLPKTCTLGKKWGKVTNKSLTTLGKRVANQGMHTGEKPAQKYSPKLSGLGPVPKY